MRLFGGHRIIARFFFTYVLLLIVPCVTTGVVYHRTAERLKRDVIRGNLVTLEHSVSMLDNELATLDRIVSRLFLNNDVNAFLSIPALKPGSSDVVEIIRAARVLALYRVRDELVREFMLHARRSDIIITTERVHTDIAGDYDAFFRVDDLSFPAWHERFVSHYQQKQLLPAVDVLISDKTHRVIPLVQSVPFRSGRYFTGSVIAYLDTKRLDDQLQRIPGRHSGVMFLLDANGTVLHSTVQGTAPIDVEDALARLDGRPWAEINGRRRWLVAQWLSPLTALRLVSVLPYAVITENIVSVRNTYLITTIILIIVGLAASLAFAYANSRPILEISAFAQAYTEDDSCAGRDLAFIRRNMRRLVEQNKALATYKREQQPVLRASILERLLLGTVGDEDEAGRLLSYTGISLEGPPYNVTLFVPCEYGSHSNSDIIIEKDIFRMILEAELNRQFSIRGCFVSLPNDRLAWVHGEQNADTVKSGLNRVYNRMDADYHHRLFIARGRPRRALTLLPEAYRDAVHGLEYLLFTDAARGICHFDELQGPYDTIRYSMETETNLITLVRSGRYDETAALLEHIFSENIAQRRLAPTAAWALLSALENTAARIDTTDTRRESVVTAYDAFQAGSSVHEAFDLVRRRFLRLCGNAHRLHETKMNDLRASILAHIEEVFDDPSVNLSRVAARFGHKESYFYHLFLDLTGMTFAAYVENRRMEEAERLLSHGDRTIDTIAASSGYNSAHTFRRAFKRHTGLTPSEFQSALTGA